MKFRLPPGAVATVEYDGRVVGSVMPDGARFVPVTLDGKPLPSRASVMVARQDLIDACRQPGGTALASTRAETPTALARRVDAGIELGGRVLDVRLARALWTELGMLLDEESAGRWAELARRLDREYASAIAVTLTRPGGATVAGVALYAPERISVRTATYEIAILARHERAGELRCYSGFVCQLSPTRDGVDFARSRHRVRLDPPAVAELVARQPPVVDLPAAEVRATYAPAALPRARVLTTLEPRKELRRA